MAARTVAAVAMLAALSRAITVKPHLDSQCKNATTFTVSNGDPRDSFEPRGISHELSNVDWALEADFPDAEPGEGSSAYDIWWLVTDLDPGCRFSLITDYTQTQYGMVPGVDVPGNQMLNVGDSGCYYSSIPSLKNIGGTFCCGRGDCTRLNMGNAAISLKKREEDQPPTEKRDARRKHAKGEQRAAMKAALERREDEWDGTGCEVVDTNGPYTQAGHQTIVGSTQYCGSNTACSFPVSGSISSGTTLSSSYTQTITNGMDFGIDVSVGTDFIVKTDVSTHIGYNFAESIAEQQGMSVDKSKSFSVGNTLTQKPGTRAFLTFTPTYQCVEAKLDCGGGVSDPLWMCNPESADEQLQGDYMVVYTN